MKVADIRPDDVMVGQRSAMQADIDWLAARRSNFVHAPCPACGTDAADLLYEKYAMSHRRCVRCRTQYVSPRPPAEILGAFYAQSENYSYWAKYIFPQSREARRAQLFRPRAEMLAQVVAARGRNAGVLVEVGAAHGLFCEEMRKLGLFSRLIAIEPTPDLAETCRQLGLETIETPFEQVKLDATADAVVSFEVIEHLFDPGAFLRWCRSLLCPGGILFLTCPNIEGFDTTLLGRDSDTVDHEHLNLFTPDSLKLLAERCGFTAVEVTTPGRLDVEIVQKFCAGASDAQQRLGPMLSRLVMHRDWSVATRLQDLLADAGLSSHMRLVAARQ